MKMKYVWIICCVIAFFSCKKDLPNDVNAEQRNAQPEITDSQYTLVWADEFNYSGLPDSTHWGYETGYVRNDEAQYYQARKLANSKVKNGKLIITAKYDSSKKNPITSASIITKGKFNFQYGKIEVKAKMPAGSGAWPAIWTLGINHDTIGWPRCGEIDILEWLGWAPQYILGSIYTATASGDDTSRVTPYIPFDASTLSSKFHVYVIEWDSTQIKYFYDNINYANYKASEITSDEWKPFTKPHYLLLNLAIGGSAGGEIDYTKFPFIYQIDYVRYYKR